MIVTASIQAQNDLNFDKKSVQCEDKWVTFKMNKDSIYTFGFIYIDQQAGLTFRYEGDFKIDLDGKFIKQKIEQSLENNPLIVRLKPNISQISEIPESRFIELAIEKTPSWLAIYKEGEDTIERLFKWGYMYNGWSECEKALSFLLKAEKINPNYEGLQTELAYSYNHLGQYKNAEKALKEALKISPKDCYTLKELAYCYRHQENLIKSEEVYKNMVKVCSEKKYIQETAYNLAYKYFELKNSKEFKRWSEEVIKWSDEENIYTKNVQLMKTQLK